jgi:hypothetical protein
MIAFHVKQGNIIFTIDAQDTINLAYRRLWRQTAEQPTAKQPPLRALRALRAGLPSTFGLAPSGWAFGPGDAERGGGNTNTLGQLGGVVTASAARSSASQTAASSRPVSSDRTTLQLAFHAPWLCAVPKLENDSSTSCAGRWRLTPEKGCVNGSSGTCQSPLPSSAPARTIRSECR